MSEPIEDVRQNSVSWWLMQGGLVFAFIIPMMVLLYGALSALNVFTGIHFSWRMALIWGGGWVLILSIGAALVVPWLWNRFVTPYQTANERRRYRAMSKDEDTLPASAWSDEVEE